MDQITEILLAAKKSLATAYTNQRCKWDLTYEDTKELIAIAYLCGIQKRGHESDTLGDSTMAHISSAANWLSGNHKPGLLLFGGVGNGKTTLANAIAGAIDAFNTSVDLWENNPANMKSFYMITRSEARSKVSFPKATIISTLEISKITDTEKLKRYKDSKFLILDDLGCEPSVVKSFGNEISQVSEVLYNRYESLLPTILTTNLDKVGLRAFYGPRIADRLEEFCDCIGFTNKSFRK